MEPHHCPSLSADLLGTTDPTDRIAFFKGIPYASITKRWTQSAIINTLHSPFDATKFGPKCPQPSHLSLLPATITGPVLEVDEFNCLNVNITVPKDELSRPEKPLPVMVWVHGGAFKNGTNSDPRYEPSAFMDTALKTGHPIVLVQISYRLGILGFAASSDLLSENETQTTAFANFGLHDQRTAFAWIKDHIADFGGDPDNVTAFGVSAGAASLHMHILSGQPQFDRAILMSGCGPTMGPYPMPLFEKSWTKLCINASVSFSPSGAERLELLRKLSADEVMAATGASSAAGPLADGAFLDGKWKLDDPHPLTRCKEVMVGNTLVEAIIFDALSAHLPQEFFLSRVQHSFPEPGDSMRFCELFGFEALLEGRKMTAEEYKSAIRNFLSTVVFHYPSLRVAESFASADTKSYLYRFETPSPYPGPTQGLAVHGQCAFTLFGSDIEVWKPQLQMVSREMVKLWTGFACGVEPWTKLDTEVGEGRVMVFGDGEVGVGGLEEGDEAWGRENGTLGWLRTHFGGVWGLVMGLMG